MTDNRQDLIRAQMASLESVCQEQLHSLAERLLLLPGVIDENPQTPGDGRPATEPDKPGAVPGLANRKETS
jgi:hypothetical protein